MQWGKSGTDSNGNITITFPISFTSNIPPIVNGNALSNSETNTNVLVKTLSNTTCTFHVRSVGASWAEPSSAPVLWTAIGY